MDYFTTAVLMKILEKADVKYNFLQVLFGLNKPENRIKHMTNNIEIKLRKGAGNKTTKTVGSTGAARVNNGATFTPLTITAPRFREKTGLTASWALGVVPTGASASNDALKKVIIGNILKEQQDNIRVISTTHERMIAQILQTGKIVIDNDPSGTFTLDLGPKTSHFEDYNTVDATKLWSTSYSKLDFIREQEAKLLAAGYTADRMILGKDAASKFLNDAAVQKILDTKAIDAGVMKLQGLDVGGFRALGRFDGKDVYSYEAMYTAPDGTAAYFIDPRAVILTSSMSPFEMHFGAIKDMKNIEGDIVAEFFSKSWEEEDPSVRWLLVESDSTPACLDVDSIYCAIVLAPAA